MRELLRKLGWFYLLQRSSEGGVVGAIATGAIAHKIVERTDADGKG